MGIKYSTVPKINNTVIWRHEICIKASSEISDGVWWVSGRLACRWKGQTERVIRCRCTRTRTRQLLTALYLKIASSLTFQGIVVLKHLPAPGNSGLRCFPSIFLRQQATQISACVFFKIRHLFIHGQFRVSSSSETGASVRKPAHDTWDGKWTDMSRDEFRYLKPCTFTSPVCLLGYTCYETSG